MAPPFAPELAPSTELDQITTALVHLELDGGEQQASAVLWVAAAPEGSDVVVGCGLRTAAEELQRLAFEPEDLDHLARLRGTGGAPLLGPGAIDQLRDVAGRCDLWTVPEGTVLRPGEPLLRISGPTWLVLLAETVVHSCVAPPTWVATRAARLCALTGGQPVLEYARRHVERATEALSVSRAAYVGGCAATSNALAARACGIPARGFPTRPFAATFDDSATAAVAYAATLPHNALLLLDGPDLPAAVGGALEVGERLRQHGRDLVAVRLDHPDLAPCSRLVRAALNERGFRSTLIAAGGDRSIGEIERLAREGIPVDVWIVGTALLGDTPGGQGRLSYEITATRTAADDWTPRCRPAHVGAAAAPGLLGLRRYRGVSGSRGDVVYDLRFPPSPKGASIGLPGAPGSSPRELPGNDYDELLQPVLQQGNLLGELPELDAIRARAGRELRVVRDSNHPVYWEQSLLALSSHLLAKAPGT